MKILMTVVSMILFSAQFSFGNTQAKPVFEIPKHCEVLDEQGAVVEKLDYKFGVFVNKVTERAYQIEDGYSDPTGQQVMYGQVLGVAVLGGGSVDWRMEYTADNGFFKGTLYVTTSDLMGGSTESNPIECNSNDENPSEETL